MLYLATHLCFSVTQHQQIAEALGSDKQFFCQSCLEEQQFFCQSCLGLELTDARCLAAIKFPLTSLSSLIDGAEFE